MPPRDPKGFGQLIFLSEYVFCHDEGTACNLICCGRTARLIHTAGFESPCLSERNAVSLHELDELHASCQVLSNVITAAYN